MEESKFKLIGVGQVIKDKTDNSSLCEVYLSESMPTVTGNLSQEDDVKIHNTNYIGSHYSLNVKKRKTITAKWLSLYNSNRLTPPDVVANEFVHIFQMAGSDEYFWTSISIGLRKKERVIYYFSNKTESKPNEESYEEGYYFMVDTKEKQLVLHTADNDGEASKYDFIMDTKEGSITLTDKQGNYIHIASTANDGIQSININDTIQINTKNIIQDGSETHTINTKNQVMNNNVLVINVKDNCVINTPKFGIFGNGDEIIQILLDFIQESADEMHIGNLGIPTAIHGESRAALMAIKSRLAKFKSGGSGDTGKQYTM